MMDMLWKMEKRDQAAYSPGYQLDHCAVGHYLRQRREGSGMSVAEMARLMDMDRKHLIRLECGRYPWTEKVMNTYLRWCRHVLRFNLADPEMTLDWQV